MNDLYFNSCFTAETTFAVKTQQLKQNETAARLSIYLGVSRR
jgi:hypothetical protein